MFFDASAMVAMLTGEPEGGRLACVLEGDQGPIASAIAIYETAQRIMSKSSLSGEEARRTVGEFLRTANVRVVSISEREAEIALRAFERFGKAMPRNYRIACGRRASPRRRAASPGDHLSYKYIIRLYNVQ